MVTRPPVVAVVPIGVLAAALLASGCRAVLGIGDPDIVGGDASPDAEVRPDVGRDVTTHDASRDTGHTGDATRDAGHDASFDAGHDARADAGHDATRADTGGLGDAGAPLVDASLLVGLEAIPTGASPDNDYSGQSEAYQIKAVRSGTVQTLGVLLLDTTRATVVFLGLYDSALNDAGQMAPNNLIATLTITPGGPWETRWYSGPPTTGSPVTITAPSTYWFALLTPTGVEGVDGGEVDYYDFNSNLGQPSAGAGSNVLTTLPTTSSGWQIAQTASPMVAFAVGM